MKKKVGLGCQILAGLVGLEALWQVASGPQKISLGVLSIASNRMCGHFVVALALLLVGSLLVDLQAFRRGWFVAAASLLAFVGNVRLMGATDTVPNSFVPFSLLQHGTFSLDPYPEAETAFHREQPCVRRYGEHRMACAAIGVSLLALPVFAPAALLGRAPTDDHRILLEKWSAALLAAASCWLLYSVFRKQVGDDMRALVAVAMFALGTSMLPIAGQAMWQFSGVVFGLSVACYGLFCAQRPWVGIVVGLGCAIAVWSRVLSLIMVPWLIVELYRRSRSYLEVVKSGAVALPFAMLLFLYNRTYFGGGTTTGYGHVGYLFGVSAERFFGYLFSPGRGLLLYCPLVLFACVGLWRHAWPLFAAVLSHLAVLGSWNFWDGAHSAGPRLWTDMVVLIGVGLGFVVKDFAHSKWLKTAAVYSVLMHVMLAYAPVSPRAEAIHKSLVQSPWAWQSYAPVAFIDPRPFP